MISEYTENMNQLIQWINGVRNEININGCICRNINIIETRAVIQKITIISDTINMQNNIYSNELNNIAPRLFFADKFGNIKINFIAFGELKVIISFITQNAMEQSFWIEIHPRIIKESYSLYHDGHHTAAAEKAIKEVEQRLREKFIELKPNEKVPKTAMQLVGALLSENGSFKFANTSTDLGKDYRKGIQQVFEGAITAYRNPSAHSNIQYSKHECMEQIVLASQLIYILDK